MNGFRVILTSPLLQFCSLMYLNLTMSLILDLPGELLLLIFENLNDLDDVLHLGRACKQLYSCLDGGQNRLRIYKSVIV